MAQKTPTTANRWQVGLALLVALFLVAMVASFTLAARRVSRVVDTDYYSHGLHYGQDQAANTGRTWSIAPRLAGSELEVQVRDQQGAPLTGGTLSFQALGTDKLTPAPLRLTEHAPGLFSTPRPAISGAPLRGTLTFTRGDATASRKMVLVD